MKIKTKILRFFNFLTFGVEVWALDFGLWTLDFGLWALNLGLWALGFEL